MPNIKGQLVSCGSSLSLVFIRRKDTMYARVFSLSFSFLDECRFKPVQLLMKMNDISTTIKLGCSIPSFSTVSDSVATVQHVVFCLVVVPQCINAAGVSGSVHFSKQALHSFHVFDTHINRVSIPVASASHFSSKCSSF